MSDEDTHFSGEIKVAARVIDYLSSGLYQNAAACMKELINNSYDADATLVKISVKPDADVIVVEDDGSGMSRDDFIKHFSHVAESHKRDSGEKTAKDRLKVGKIGIGFIAANEICDEMEIYSTQQGSSELLHVTIDFGEIRDRSFPERRRGDTEVVKGDYDGEILEEDPDEHYTKIYLKRIRESARDEFLRPTGRAGAEDAPSLYGLKPKTVRRILGALSSWDELDLYSQTRLRIGLNVPVCYLPDWYPSQYEAELQPLTTRAEKLGFRVIYDGTDLLKPTILTDPDGQSVLHPISYESDQIQVAGYMFARHRVYKPKDLNGLLLRIRESAVGDYDRRFMDYPTQLSALFQGWCTAELYVDGDLDDALNIDRRTLRNTHPAFVELQEWFIAEFGAFLTEVRDELYNKPSKERSGEKVRAQQEQISKVKTKAAKDIGPRAAKAIEKAFPTPKADRPTSQRQQRDFLRTYNVAQIYDIAIDAAKAVLPPELADQFIEEFSRRLHD